ncbi:hypothetical protein [Brevibacillus daliensis]|uniref:hypothetical protein n=1 Tax=Brevibacillus daliensis TaxID=2892995 RepID=UPI001E311E21|nr:hypothetical protein [Brevibacillus daliensis]
MLTFEQKQEIIESFPELAKKAVSLGRFNYHFEESKHEKKIVVNHLHPNGNGFVYAGHLPKKKTDQKGMVNIRDYSADELRTLIAASIDFLSKEPVEPVEKQDIYSSDEQEAVEETWANKIGQTLQLLQEDDLWNLYTGSNLEMSTTSYKEAVMYLQEEGFYKKA